MHLKVLLVYSGRLPDVQNGLWTDVNRIYVRTSSALSPPAPQLPPTHGLELLHWQLLMHSQTI